MDILLNSNKVYILIYTYICAYIHTYKYTSHINYYNSLIYYKFEYSMCISKGRWHYNNGASNSALLKARILFNKQLPIYKDLQRVLRGLSLALTPSYWFITSVHILRHSLL